MENVSRYIINFYFVSMAFVEHGQIFKFYTQAQDMNQHFHK